MKLGRRYETYVKSYVINETNEPEYFSVVGDIYATPEFRSTEKNIQHADITCRQHMLSVSYMSYTASKRKHLQARSAARAALMHDLVYYDWHEKGDGSHRLHGYRHPGFALKNAKALFPLSALEENIILRHMWPLTPIPPKYRESFLVSMADKYCAMHEILIKKFPSYQKKFRRDVAKAGEAYECRD